MSHVTLQKLILSGIALFLTGYAGFQALRDRPENQQVVYGKACTAILVSPEMDKSQPFAFQFPREDRLAPVVDLLDRRQNMQNFRGTASPRGVFALMPQEDYLGHMELVLDLDKRIVDSEGEDSIKNGGKDTTFLGRVTSKLVKNESRLPRDISISCNRPTIFGAGLGWFAHRYRKTEELRGLLCNQLEVIILASQSELECIGRGVERLGATSNNLGQLCPLTTKVVLLDEQDKIHVSVPDAVRNLTERNQNFLVATIEEYEYLLGLERHVLLVDATESIQKPVTAAGLNEVVSKRVFTTLRARVPYLGSHTIDYHIFGESQTQIDSISLDELQVTPPITGQHLTTVNKTNTNLVSLLALLNSKLNPEVGDEEPPEGAERDVPWESVWIYSDFDHKPEDPKSTSVEDWMTTKGCNPDPEQSAGSSLLDKPQLYLQYPETTTQENLDTFESAARCLGFVVHRIPSAISGQSLKGVCKGYVLSV